MRRRLVCGLSLVAALIVGVCVAGCGSSSTTTETTAVISKGEFVKQGNAVCAKGEKQQQTEATAFFKKNGIKKNQKPTKAQQTELVEVVFIPNIQSQIDGVKALGAPSGEEQQVSAALETSQQILDKAKANPVLFFSEEHLFAPAGKQLHALGLKACAPNS